VLGLVPSLGFVGSHQTEDELEKQIPGDMATCEETRPQYLSIRTPEFAV
jgi:hypothetical protein